MIYEGDFAVSDSLGYSAAWKIVVSYGGVNTTMDVSVGLPPVLLEDFENGLEKYKKTDGAAFNKALVTVETNQDYVRSGSHSLRLEYDFTGKTGTSGAYLTVASIENCLQIPGYPEKISLWVYGDGNKHWLRGQFRDGDNKIFNVDYTDADEGLDWVGWKYVEVDFPKGKKLPLSMEMPVRYMEMRNHKKDAGVIYIDDIRVLYGPSNDDILPPVIKNMVPAAGSMVNDAHPAISFIAEDEGYDAATSPDNTLIDPKSIRVYVDGELVDYKLYLSQGRVTYKPAAPLTEGKHRIKAAVRDLSGNQTIIEWDFTVNLGSPYYSYTTPEKQFAGGTYTLDIYAEQVSVLSGGHIEFALDPSAVEGLKVIHAEKLKEEQLEAGIDELSGKVRLSFMGLQDAQLKDSDLLGQISYKIKNNYIGPLRLEDLEKDVKKPHSVSFVSGSIEKTGAPGNNLAFYGERVTSDVWADLKLSWNHYTIGLGSPSQFTITNAADGSKVEGAALIIDDVAVADTSSNKEGILLTDSATQQVKTYRIQAVKDQMYSPVMNFTVANPVFTKQPVNISVAMGEEPAESRRFNWHTHIDVKDTIVEYVKESEFSSFTADNVQRATGSNELFNTHSYGTYRVHRAEVTGLEPGTAYKFRVGNGGDLVSAEGRFSTSEVSGDTTKFVFIGDSQGGTEKDYVLWKNTIDSAIADMPDAEFIVHAGDMVDKGFLQQQWNWWFGAAQQHLMERTLITAVGNHEVMGTNGAGDYLAHFNNPDSGASSVQGTSFSFDVKDTHFVLLNSELGEAAIEEQAQWLDRDLAATDKKWKVMMFHQGPYGSVYANERVLAQWAPIFDKYGVDLVLNGHDHVYMRTYLMKGGAAAEKVGTRYVIGGSSGSKFYALVNRPWQEVTFDQHNVNIYTSVVISKDEIKVTAKTVAGQIVDSFVID